MNADGERDGVEWVMDWEVKLGKAARGRGGDDG